MTDLVEAVARAVSFDRGGIDGGHTQYDEWLARAVLAAIEVAGYRVVPVEPTEAMVHRGSIVEGDGVVLPSEVRAIWQAMLKAAPSAASEPTP